MWKDVYTLRKTGSTRISNSVYPNTINFSTLFSKNDVFNKTIFPISGDIISNVNIYGWNLSPYSITDNSFTINPYMTNRGIISKRVERCIPVVGGEYTIDMGAPVDYLSISFLGEDMFAGSWTYAYRASVYLNDIYVGKIISNAGIFVSPMSNVVKTMPAPHRSSRGTVSGTMVASSLYAIDIPSTNHIRVSVRDVEFHGSLNRQGIFSVNIDARTGGEQYGKTPCNTGIFVFGS